MTSTTSNICYWSSDSAVIQGLQCRSRMYYLPKALASNEYAIDFMKSSVLKFEANGSINQAQSSIFPIDMTYDRPVLTDDGKVLCYKGLYGASTSNSNVYIRQVYDTATDTLGASNIYLLSNAYCRNVYASSNLYTSNVVASNVYSGMLFGDGSALSNLNASLINSGTLNNARLPSTISISGTMSANQFSGDGSLLSNLPSTSKWTNEGATGIYTLSNVAIGSNSSAGYKLNVAGEYQLADPTNLYQKRLKTITLASASTQTARLTLTGAYSGRIIIYCYLASGGLFSHEEITLTFNGIFTSTKEPIVNEYKRYSHYDNISTPTEGIDTRFKYIQSTGTLVIESVRFSTTQYKLTYEIQGCFNSISLVPTVASSELLVYDREITPKYTFDNEISGNDKSTTGRIGIGTNQPAYPLEVSGTVKATNFIGNGGGLSNVGQWTDVPTQGIAYLGLLGKVGVNTSNLTDELTVVGNGRFSKIGIGRSPINALDVLGQISTNSTISSSNAIISTTAEIGSRVGIGTSPAAPFHVVGSSIMESISATSLLGTWALFTDEQANNVNGGQSSLTGNRRAFNTTHQTFAGCSIGSGGVINLPIGRFLVHATSSIIEGTRCLASIRRVSPSSLIYGVGTGYNTSATMTEIIVSTIIDTTQSITIEMWQRVTSTGGSRADALGVPHNISGFNNTYGRIFIFKLS